MCLQVIASISGLSVSDATRRLSRCRSCRGKVPDQLRCRSCRGKVPDQLRCRSSGYRVARRQHMSRSLHFVWKSPSLYTVRMFLMLPACECQAVCSIAQVWICLFGVCFGVRVQLYSIVYLACVLYSTCLQISFDMSKVVMNPSCVSNFSTKTNTYFNAIFYITRGLSSTEGNLLELASTSSSSSAAPVATASSAAPVATAKKLLVAKKMPKPMGSVKLQMTAERSATVLV